jgi:hypothetical protein
MNPRRLFFVLLALWVLLANKGNADQTITVITPAHSTPLLTLAARETVRYEYLRTGHLLPIHATDKPSGDGAIVIGIKGDHLLDSLVLDSKTQTQIAALKSQQYLLKTLTDAQGTQRLLIAGGDGVGALYGTYRFIEHLGVRFYIQGDAIPDALIPLALPVVDEVGKPLFALRGIQPFHDFPEGPDWWNRDDYLAYVEQLPKMRMNFIGIHTYPTYPTPEPAVWVGTASDMTPDGQVTFSYPSSWANTQRAGWGIDPGVTSGFSCGASELFPADIYGPDVMEGMMPTPATPQQCNLLFNRVGSMYHDVFTEAQALGIKTCVGTETPLIISPALQDHLKSLGKDPNSRAARQDLYEGIFRRIAATYPVDYYWLWTPEVWTWNGNTPEQLAKTVEDIQDAISAVKKVGQPFQLATCGWVLGPANDRAALDKVLPKDMPMSSINRNVGNEPIDSAYGEITDRPTWTIPWLENDPQLTVPQPWVGRMLYDAADARRLGCSGLFGIHWRTKAISPNIAALASAAWDQSYVPSGFAQGALDGKIVAFTEPVAGTSESAIYQTLRFDTNGYRLEVPNGIYTVTLKFNEPHYQETGKRVFGIKLQGKQVVEHLDVFARVGGNHALDLTYSGIEVKDGWLKIDFTREVEFPMISGIVIRNGNFSRKINCGGPALDGYEADTDASTGRDQNRSIGADAFYKDFALANFGPEIGEAAGKIMAEVDGVNLVKPVAWADDGPGALAVNRTPWQSQSQSYAFVDQFAALRPKIIGKGNLDRFDYWLNSYRYLEACAHAGCIRGELDIAMEKIAAATDADKKKELATTALDLRISLTRLWEQLMNFQEAVVSTPGELGTIANLELHSRRHHFLDADDAKLSAALGTPLPDAVNPTSLYKGAPRIIVPTVRSQISPGEQLHLDVILLGSPSPGVLFWRPLGQGPFTSIPLTHKARSVYEVTLPAMPPTTTIFEYYIEAGSQNSLLRYPATAPNMNQTVVISSFEKRKP